MQVEKLSNKPCAEKHITYSGETLELGNKDT